VHVGIPWRAGDPWREQAFAYVQIHLRGAGLDPVPYDNGADIFSRAGSRNLAVRCADADVVILLSMSPGGKPKHVNSPALFVVPLFPLSFRSDLFLFCYISLRDP
jgi:hypothetical protein